MQFEVKLVGKIGSMALISQKDNLIDYTRVARLSRELTPGTIWVSSGATEIGRLDYRNRTGKELPDCEESKADYAAQGQSILMETYRRYIDPAFNVRQVLVEHQHFNDPEKCEHLKNLLLRCKDQNAIPIINYNDCVSSEENRRLEIASLSAKGKVYECVDNDETAARIATLVHAKTLLILTSADGIYADPADPSTLIEEIAGRDDEALLAEIERCKSYCAGASRKLAGGARAKLEYVKEAALQGTEVIIANAKYSIAEVLGGNAPCTRIHKI
ncbi:MAG: uridylate kinase [Clostridia bacterium]|nr:uridylate kinase [Clostridia bacterium]